RPSAIPRLRKRHESSKRCWLTTPSTMPRARGLDHLARGRDIRRDRLLHLNVLAGFGARLQRLQPKIRKGADVHVVHRGVRADVPVIGEKLAAMLGRK